MAGTKSQIVDANVSDAYRYLSRHAEGLYFWPAGFTFSQRDEALQELAACRREDDQGRGVYHPESLQAWRPGQTNGRLALPMRLQSSPPAEA